MRYHATSSLAESIPHERNGFLNEFHAWGRADERFHAASRHLNLLPLRLHQRFIRSA